ncbi:hypothetical protein SAMN02990966_01635 [Rhodospirillales bacterium URHD0017]|nr:hypothetical protein SAMN02990966_01635 [Rhodospirillales bacterium URHD0017]
MLQLLLLLGRKRAGWQPCYLSLHCEHLGFQLFREAKQFDPIWIAQASCEPPGAGRAIEFMTNLVQVLHDFTRTAVTYGWLRHWAVTSRGDVD